jgi:serine/threonine protein kinase/tetratricopeptide (TPR) repeat protein
MSADPHLLFGLLALQNGLIQQAHLVAAFHAWTINKSRPLADHLVALGHLNDAQRSAIEALAALHVDMHGGDAEQSLANLSVCRSTLDQLWEIGDPEMSASLTGVGYRSTDLGREQTATFSVGTATSDGQRFRVLRPHARGGLGAVFVALDGELNREVALKQILDDYADDPRSRQRFLLEAEVTGQLEHPGIVPVYGLGAYKDGRPYYAMRFVRGDSLREAIERFHADVGWVERSEAHLKTQGHGYGARPWWASKTRPTLRDSGRRSLELRKLLRRFQDVCNAIEYAHSRGVLHRDIKPGNIIVGKHGETLVVDWGLAKATGRAEPGAEERALSPSPASGSAETIPGSAVGTPAYMSPEQARGDLDALGPRSDVYSLGATLYCLLTGGPPLVGDDIGEILRRVQRGEFPPPRSVDPSIGKALEAVCQKAMANRPGDRYPSCRALADDVERWMADEPVSAYREPGLARLSRWGRRHRSLVAAAVAILATATAGLGAGLVAVNAEKDRTELARQGESQQRRRAEAGEKQARDQEKLARAKEAEIKAVLGFVEDKILAAARPEGHEGGLGPEVTLRKALEAALPQVESAFRGEPLVEARVRSTLGVSFSYLGDPKTAGTQFEIARERLSQKLGRDHPDTLMCGNNLAINYWDQGRYLDAVKLHEESLSLLKVKLGADDPATLKSMNNLAVAYQTLGRYADAVKLYEQTVELMKAKRGKDDFDTLTSMGNLAAGYLALGQPEAALKLAEQVVALETKKLGRDSPSTLGSLSNLAEIHQVLGHQTVAFEMRREVLALRKAKLGLDHPDTLWSMGTLAESLIDLGRYAEAVTLIDECLRRGEGRTLDPRLVPGVLDLRLRAMDLAFPPHPFAGAR